MSGTLAAATYFSMILALCALTLRRPGAALIVASCMFALKQWAEATGGIFAAHQSLTNWIAGAIVLAGVGIHLLRGNLRMFAYSKEFWLIMLLYLYSLVSIAWAPLVDVSFHHWIEALPYIATIIVLAPLLVQSTADLKTAYAGLLAFGTVLALLLLFTVPWDGRQIVLGHSGSEDEGGNPLTIGQLGGTLLILAVLYQPNTTARLWTLLKWCAGGVGLALVARSGSRGQLGAALVVASALWMIASTGKRSFKPALAVVVVGLLALGASAAKDMFWAEDPRFQAANMGTDLAGRWGNAVVLLSEWLKSPGSILFGLGNSASFDPRILGNYPHIVPLEILGEEGVVGFALFAVCVAGILSAALREYRDSAGDSGRRNLYVCLLGLWIYSLFLINKQGSLLLSQDFFLNSILLVSYGRLYAGRRSAVAPVQHTLVPENLLA